MNVRNHLVPAVVLVASCWLAPAALAQQAAPSTQAGMDASANTGFAAADRQLNKVYQEVLKKHAGDTEFTTRFRAAEKAWLAFRDAEVAAHYPARDALTEYGTAYPMCVADLKTRLTLQRIKELQAWVNGAQEGDVCAGSVGVQGN